MNIDITYCLSDNKEDFSKKFYLVFTSGTEFKLVKELDNKRFDIYSSVVTTKSRVLKKGLVAKEYNSNCLDNTKYGIRKIFSGTKYLGSFKYQGIDTDEYLITKDGRYLWGEGGMKDAVYSSVLILDMNTLKFGEANSDGCTNSIDPVFSDDGTKAYFSNYNISSGYSNDNLLIITIYQCSFKSNGEYISGTETRIQYDISKSIQNTEDKNNS